MARFATFRRSDRAEVQWPPGGDLHLEAAGGWAGPPGDRPSCAVLGIGFPADRDRIRGARHGRPSDALQGPIPPNRPKGRILSRGRGPGEATRGGAHVDGRPGPWAVSIGGGPVRGQCRAARRGRHQAAKLRSGRFDPPSSHTRGDVAPCQVGPTEKFCEKILDTGRAAGHDDQRYETTSLQSNTVRNRPSGDMSFGMLFHTTGGRSYFKGEHHAKNKGSTTDGT